MTPKKKSEKKTDNHKLSTERFNGCISEKRFSKHNITTLGDFSTTSMPTELLKSQLIPMSLNIECTRLRARVLQCRLGTKRRPNRPRSPRKEFWESRGARDTPSQRSR